MIFDPCCARRKGSTENHSAVFLNTCFISFHFTRVIQHCRDTRRKDTCRTKCNSTIVGHIWQMTFTLSWEIVGKVQKYAIRDEMTPPTTIPRKWRNGICPCGHPETISEETKQCPALFVGMDRYKKVTRVVQSCKTTAFLIV